MKNNRNPSDERSDSQGCIHRHEAPLSFPFVPFVDE
jgi:hypothetical protein